MKVLSVASEAFPLVKTGGLADVVGALPAALARHGVEMRVLVPAYPSVLQKMRTIGAGRPKKVCEFASLLGATGRLLETRIGGADFLLLDIPDLFDRPGGPYADASGDDHADNWRRFAALSRAAANIAEGALGWIPDVVHVHDWQAALTPLYLAQGPAAATPSVMTIHNLAFQGRFGAEIFEQLGLPSSVFSMEGLEYYGDVSFLKGGIHTASAVTTVSPTYAQEIRGPEFGMGLDGVVNARADDLYGIVNGIDTEVWNPETDPLIPANFSSGKRRGRAVNRRALVERFGLNAQVEGPVFTLISRLTWQKGIDVLIEVAGDLVAMGGRLAVLGSGERTFEEALQAAATRHPGRIGIVTGYDEPLSHLMQAGGDAILVPSRFEPCGLTQLCGLRYGSIPVVTRTGGLADTVIDANEAAMAAGVATGFQFSPLTADTFRHAIRRTIGAFSDRTVWERLQHQGMTADVSWDRSGLAYARLYRNLIEEKK